MAEAVEPPVFVVGCGRSGTTLLASLINRHSRMSVPPETQFMTEILPRVEAAGTDADHDDMLEILFASRRIQAMQLDEEQVRSRFEGGAATPRRLFACALTTFASQQGTRRWAEKTPAHLRHVPRLMRWFPDARVVCIVRDGRDVVRSFRRVPWAHDSTVRHALKWRELAVLARDHQQRFRDSFRVVRYEDLVRDPEAEVRDLCSFVGLEFEPGQLEAASSETVIPSWEEEWKSRARGVPDPSRIGQWRESATAYQRRLMERAMGPMLEYWGYVPEGEGEGAGGMLRDLVARAHLAPFHPSVRPAFRRMKRALRRMGMSFPRTTSEVSVSGFEQEPGEGS